MWASKYEDQKMVRERDIELQLEFIKKYPRSSLLPFGKIWATILSILRLFYQKSDKIRYGSMRETRVALRELGAYLIFLYIAVRVTQTTTYAIMYYANDVHKQMLAVRKVPIERSWFLKFTDVASAEYFWKFLDLTFLELTTHNDYNPDDPAGVYKLGNMANSYSAFYGEVNNRTLLHGNFFMGAPRLRQIRVKKNSCVKNQYFRTEDMTACFGPYSWTREMKDSYFGSTWRSCIFTATLPVWTDLEIYIGEGFIINFTYEYAENRRLIAELQRKKWIDGGTRMVMLEYNLFHLNSRLMSKNKFMLECLPSGGCFSNVRQRVVRTESYFNDQSLKIRLMIFLFYIITVMRTVNEVGILRRIGWYAYRTNLLNAVDGSICVLSYMMLLYQVIHHLYMMDILEDVRNKDTFISLDWVCFWNVHYDNWAAIMVFLLWMRLLHFIGFNRTMIIFINVVKSSASDMFGFAVLMTAVFVGYAQFGRVLFGSKLDYFKNYSTASLTMLRWMLADFNYEHMSECSTLIVPIYCTTYILFVYLILLHVFLAIINVSYDVVKRNLLSRPQKLTAVFRQSMRDLYSFIFLLVRCRKRRLDPNRVLETEEDDYEADQRADPREAADYAALRNLNHIRKQKIPPRIFFADRLRESNNILGLAEELLRQMLPRFNYLEKEWYRHIPQLPRKYEPEKPQKVKKTKKMKREEKQLKREMKIKNKEEKKRIKEEKKAKKIAEKAKKKNTRK